MKNIFRYTFVAVSGMLFTGALASCEKSDAEEDRGATPVIKYARSCNAAAADSLITRAMLGSKLCFVGDNLGDVQQVWFNDQKAKLNPTMVTSHSLIVDVPNNIPAEVNDMARFITSTGIEIEVPFKVDVPAPRVEGMSCEYAPNGETVVIRGAYFADDPNVPIKVYFGELEADVKKVTQDELSVVIPQGATEAPITVATIYGEGESSFNYMDTNGMLFDFEIDGKTGLALDGGDHGWHPRPIENDGTGISGNYIVFGDGATELTENADWDEDNYIFNYWAGAWTDPISYPDRLGNRLFDIVDFSDYSNMCLKFEVCIDSKNAWQAGALQMIFAGTDRVTTSGGGIDIYGNTVVGANNKFFQDKVEGQKSLGRGLWRPWTASEAYHTDGKWITVSFPIKDFVYNSEGAMADEQISSKEYFSSFTMFLWAGGVTGKACTPVLKIDNIRAVKM